MKSLLVDDDPVSLHMLRHVVQPFGPVVGLTTGLGAVDAFKSALDDHQPFDLVCLDIRLPDRPGNQVLTSLRWIERVRLSPSDKKARILMVSGVSDVAMIRSVIPDGCDGYVLKPVDPVEFEGRLRGLGLMGAEGEAIATGGSE